MPALDAASAISSFDYFMFEQRFRGTVAEIKERQAKYLHLFLGCERVLDIGCGRGEFLELLAEQDIGATGVDMSLDMVQFCRERGLQAECGDMFDYLSVLPDASLSGIFAAQVVEHLPPARIAELVALCSQKLRVGGLMVAETVNPACPVAMGHFYLDPSHVRPVPAELLHFLFEQRGFTVRSVLFSAPIDSGHTAPSLTVTAAWPMEVSQYQDYGVVAIRE